MNDLSQDLPICGSTQSPAEASRAPRLGCSSATAEAMPEARRPARGRPSALGYEVCATPRKIRSGKEWEGEIQDGLRSTQLVVALLSPHAVRVGETRQPRRPRQRLPRRDQLRPVRLQDADRAGDGAFPASRRSSSSGSITWTCPPGASSGKPIKSASGGCSRRSRPACGARSARYRRWEHRLRPGTSPITSHQAPRLLRPASGCSRIEAWRSEPGRSGRS